MTDTTTARIKLAHRIVKATGEAIYDVKGNSPYLDGLLDAYIALAAVDGEHFTRDDAYDDAEAMAEYDEDLV